MPLVETWVDPDASGAGDGSSRGDAYTAGATWESTEETNLVTDLDQHTCHAFSSSGGNDDGFSISGWTTDATYFITFQVDTGDRHSGVWDDSKYVINESADASGGVIIADDFTRLIGVQLDNTYSGSSTSRMLYWDEAAVGCHVAYCICRNSGGGTGTTEAFSCYGAADASDPCFIYNNIAYDNNTAAFYISGENDGANLYNNTSFDNGTGYQGGYADIDDFQNNCEWNCTTPYSLNTPGNATHNAYSSGSDPGSSGVDISSEVAGDLFLDYASDDVRLKVGSALIGVGTDNPGTGLYLDDIESETRTSTWDIGADEYVVSSVIEQEGFRFYADGTESGSTPLDSQDTDISIAKETTFQERVLLNATGDPASEQYQLEYKESSDGAAEWRKVPLT